MTEKIVIVSLECAEALLKQRLNRFYSLLLHNYVCGVFYVLRLVVSAYVT